MRIAYLACVDIEREAGVLRKLQAQCASWAHAGVEPRMFLVTRQPTQPATPVFAGSSAVVFHHDGRKREFRQAITAAAEQIASWRPDVLYHRYFRPDPMVGQLASKMCTVLEINSDDVLEYRHLLSVPAYLLHLARRRGFLRRAKAFVTVTHELQARFAWLGKPTMVLANGIDLSAIQPLPPAKDGPPTLSFLGHPGYRWHGIEKTVVFARFFPQWRFNMIGFERRDLGGTDVPGNMVLHGYLAPERYIGLLASTDVGIGTLALYRNGMSEACPLKTREYLAYGLPIIIGYRDTDFLRPAPFILQLPNGEYGVHGVADDVSAFVTAWKGKRVARQDVAHIDVASKCVRLIEFLRRVASGRNQQVCS
jgi:hypothetical protein